MSVFFSTFSKTSFSFVGTLAKWRLRCLFLLCMICLPLANSYAKLVDDLTSGQYVLFIRHAQAPGYSDPAGYQLDQCATQRNLDEFGRKQSQLIGQWLSREGVTKAHVMSSPWCRCIDTAKLLDKGMVHITPEIGSFFNEMDQAKSQTIRLEKLIQNKLKVQPHTPMIFVSHHVNIEAYTNKVINQGDMLLVKVSPDGKYLSHQIYPSPK